MFENITDVLKSLGLGRIVEQAARENEDGLDARRAAAVEALAEAQRQRTAGRPARVRRLETAQRKALELTTALAAAQRDVAAAARALGDVDAAYRAVEQTAHATLRQTLPDELAALRRELLARHQVARDQRLMDLVREVDGLVSTRSRAAIREALVEIRARAAEIRDETVFMPAVAAPVPMFERVG
jgi:hypothetical protein